MRLPWRAASALLVFFVASFPHDGATSVTRILTAAVTPATTIAGPALSEATRSERRKLLPRKELRPSSGTFNLIPHATSAHGSWQATLSWQERWLIGRESGFNPSAVNPLTGAYGLGQLEPQTYRGLRLRMSPDPWAQLRAMRAYVRERYGSESSAVAFWKSHGWY